MESMDRLRGSELWVGRSSFLHWLLGGAGWTTGFSWQRVLWVDDSQWFLFRPNLAGDVMRCQWKAEAVNTFSCDFGRVKFMGFWCICSCKWCSYGTPFAISWIRFSVKKLHSNSPLAKSQPLSSLVGKTEDFLQHARSSQASMICPVCRGEILIPEVDCGLTTMQGGLSCWTRWEYDPGQFLEDRNGNPQELYWQEFFCWHLLSSQVEEVENARCPTWSREKSDESTTDIYHFSCWSSISEMSWAVKKPCLFSVYGVDVTTQFIQKVLWYATTRIWTHHYNGKSFPDFEDSSPFHDGCKSLPML